ncbi:metallophosphoesterase [Labrenzia sp. PHM005]|uniref:metallophosphoesterase n=1 Tax=Labrenzia sp. PHM005 TaxID=2590016 RepID=UPI00114054A2|nr:metallophosphoesterase [Labrenzia sp. PHM005]QDG74810.1 metallophosphoesterase [Labrenzia sp. PHM005]
MLLLHISDIHFKSPECLDPSQDPHLAIRTRMMRDLAQQVGVLGEIDAILIGGDVAFKADPDEYHTAWNWIQELAAISGCPKGRIFTVPGNHDVDRNIIRQNVPTQSAQHMISSAPTNQREWRLGQQLANEESGQSLFAAHSAYNDFAAPFGCQVWPDKPFWHQDLPLEGGVTLRIYGLTSTLLSGQNGEDDIQGSLYLSPRQTVLNPVPNTANLVLVHHPIDWLSDADEVDDALTTRAAFHLFGHKHRQRAIMAEYVRLGAGAVNPSRGEQPYQPGYNLIALEVEGQGRDRHIKVELHQRRLQDVPERFESIKNAQGGDVFCTVIPVPEEAPFPIVSNPIDAAPSSKTDTGLNHSNTSIVLDAEAAMGETDTRELLYRFWRLTSGQRRTIITELGLLEEGELRLPEPERYGRALIRAGERNLINEIAAAVARMES